MPRADNSDRGVLITREAARRINRAVSAIERGDRDMPGYTLRTAYDDGDSLRIGRISATWSKNTTATVEEIDGDGNPLDPSVTFEAKNLFVTITVSSGHKKVACLSGYLIAAECD